MTDYYQVKAADRYITTAPVETALILHLGSTDIVRTGNAIRLSEGDRDDAYYLPIDAMPQGLLEASSQEYYCRWKGDARFFNVRVGDQLIPNGAWSYPQAPDELADIREHVAFDAALFTVALDYSGVSGVDSETSAEPA